MPGDLNHLTDQDLLDQLVRSGLTLLTISQQRLARAGRVPDDPRWGAPLPLRFESQVAVLFLGALDACDATIGLLRTRASQQAFHTLRFQIESMAIIRWMSEPKAAADRQHRAYRVACGQIRRFGRFMMRDAGRDRDALNSVRAIRDWAARLREIAKEDGIADLKQEPPLPELFKTMRDVAGYPNFSMYSEFGSHPGTAGNTFFALSGDSRNISYDLGGSVIERGFLVGASIFYLWKTCEAVSPAMSWQEWLQADAQAAYRSALPLLEESVRRRRASAGSGS